MEAQQTISRDSSRTVRRAAVPTASTARQTVGSSGKRKNAKTYYDIKSTPRDTRIIALQGGTRSGKTYSVLEILIELCMHRRARNQGIIFTIARETMPALKGSVQADFFDLVSNAQLYHRKQYNSTDHLYHLNGNVFRFLNLDDEEKVKGFKHHYLYVNEANGTTWRIFQQLLFRTVFKVLIDYNPNMLQSFIYDRVLPRDDCTLYTSTYRDNPYLPQDQIDEIERLKEEDEEAWNIYGLGKRARGQAVVYHHHQVIPYWPSVSAVMDEVIYGLDFGYNNPSSLIRIGIRDQAHYAQECFYQRYLKTADIIALLETHVIDRDAPIYADSADPEKIAEISDAGFNVWPAKKDVENGIDAVKSKPLFVTADSVHLIKELDTYSYKQDKDGIILESVVKFNDHAVDALRYGIFTHKSSQFDVFL